jgi:hypothetical protein
MIGLFGPTNYEAFDVATSELNCRAYAGHGYLVKFSRNQIVKSPVKMRSLQVEDHTRDWQVCGNLLRRLGSPFGHTQAG